VFTAAGGDVLKSLFGNCPDELITNVAGAILDLGNPLNLMDAIASFFLGAIQFVGLNALKDAWESLGRWDLLMVVASVVSMIATGALSVLLKILDAINTILGLIKSASKCFGLSESAITPVREPLKLLPMHMRRGLQGNNYPPANDPAPIVLE